MPGRAWKAIRTGLDGKSDKCNVLVDAIAPAAGAPSGSNGR
jgi:hypothetical protein